MKIKSGKKYILRNGSITKRLIFTFPPYPFYCPSSMKTFTEDGRYHIGIPDHENDIVARYKNIIIKEGERYTLRDGKITYRLRNNSCGKYPLYCPYHKISFTINGKFMKNNKKHGYDIVSIYKGDFYEIDF